MNPEDMSAEQEPLNNADQQEPQIQQLRLAPEGAFAGQIPTNQSQEGSLLPKQYDAHLGGGVPAGRQPVPGSAPTPDRQPGTGGQRFGGVKGKVASALAVLGLLGAGGVAYELSQQNGDDNSNKGPVLNIDTPTVKPQPTMEATPTVEQKKVESSPFEFGFSKKVGDVTVQITKKTQERTECPDPNSAIKSANMVPCNPTHEIVVNRDIFPDADERTREVFQKGIYFAWQHADQSRAGVSFDEYLQRVQKGEDMSIKARGFQGASFLPTDITITPTDEFFYDTIDEPISIIRPWTSLGVGYREVLNAEGKREFHLEIFDFTAGGVGDPDPTVKQYGPGNLMAVGLSYLSFPDIQNSGTFITPAQNEANGSVVVPLRDIVVKRVNGSPYSVLGAR